MTIADMFLGLRDSNDECIIHTLVPHGTRKDHTIMASTLSNASHIRSIQANAITFLQQTYPWIKRSDIFEQQDHRTPLTREHYELIINQAAHGGTIVEELFEDWDDFPPYLMMTRVWDQKWYKGHGQVDHHPITLDSILITKIPYTIIIQKQRLATVGVQLPSSVIVTLATVQIVTVHAAVTDRLQKSIKQIQHQLQTVH